MSRFHFARLALLAVVLIGCTHASPRASRYARLDAILETQARELAMPGVSAALMQHGELVWTGARGWADIEAHAPVTPDTPFNIASLTKPMAAVMLMQMAERGELSLSTPMQRYDPAFTDGRVTVGHVLSMTAQGDPPGQHYAYDGNIYGALGAVVTGVSGEPLAKAFSTRLIERLSLVNTSPGDLSADAQGLSSERVSHYQNIFNRLARPYNHVWRG